VIDFRGSGSDGDGQHGAGSDQKVMVLDADVVVVGGGIAGLVAAFDCARVGLRVVLLEQHDKLGGCIGRVELDGLTLDTGAESFAVRGDTVANLLVSLGMSDEMAVPNPVGAWLAFRGDGDVLDAAPAPATGVLGIPANPLAAEVVRILGWRGAWRAYLDRVRPVLRIGVAHSLGELVRTRMGRAVLDRLVTPVALGVYSTDPADLEVSTVAPGLNQAMTRAGSLSGGVAQLVAARKPGSAVRGITGGMHRLVDRLHAELLRFGVEVRVGAMVESVAVVKGPGAEVTGRGSGSHAAGRAEVTGCGSGSHAAGSITERDPVASVADTGWCLTATVDAMQLQVTAASLVLATPADVTARLLAPLAVGSVAGVVVPGVGAVDAPKERVGGETEFPAGAGAVDAPLPSSGVVPAVGLSGIAPAVDARVAAVVDALAGWPAAVTVDVVTLVLDAPALDDAPRGTGVLVAPGTPGVAAKALTHSTAKWPWLAAAAAGRHVVRLSYGSAGVESPLADLGLEHIGVLACADTAALLNTPIEPGMLRAVHHTQWCGAVQPTVIGQRERVAAVEAACGDGSLVLTGGWLAGTGLAAVISHAHASVRGIRARAASAGLL